MIESLGNAPLAWARPNGYPDDADALALGRRHARPLEHAHVAGRPLVAGRARAARRCESYCPRRCPKTHGELVDALAKRLVFRDAAAAHTRRRAAASSGEARRAAAPTTRGVEWRLAYLVALDPGLALPRGPVT